MATESPQSTSAFADSYIGSSITLISKSEIRYEGLLFHINPLESTIGLKNVRSFGTEGRKKDGPQVFPSDRVYDYIYFRGSDIKDLQVLPSLPVQNPPAIPNDPAIIQSHYSHPTNSASLAQANTASVTNLSSASQMGLPGSVFQGSMPQYQPMGNTGSWVPFPLLNVNSNEPHMPVYMQGLKGPAGLSNLQQQSLLGQTPGALSPHVSLQQQHMQSSMIDTSKPVSAINFPQAPPRLLPPLYASTLNSRPTSVPMSALASNTPLGGYASVTSNEVPGQMANYEPNTFPALPSFTFLSPLTPAAHTDNTVAQDGSRTLSTTSSTSSHHRLPLSSPSIVGTCDTNNVEVSVPSLVTPDQLLQSVAIKSPTKASPPHLQTAHKDIEVVQASTSEPLQVELTKEAQISLTADKKLNSTPDSDYNHNGIERGRRNGVHGASLRGHRGQRGRMGGRENNLIGTMSTSHQNNMGHGRGRGRGRGPYGRNHHNYEGHGWEKEKMNGDASSRRYGTMSRARGRTNRASHFDTKFTGDFDFEAMNEKFNKAEVWGQLGKTMKASPEDHVDTIDNNEENIEHEDASGKSKLESKPVYVKDDFFDSLSSDAFGHESPKKVKFHQQRKIDVETFGYFQTTRGRGGRGRGRGGLSRGGRHGRGGYECAGRGTWSRVS